MAIDVSQPVICVVASVHDGDTWTCGVGVRVRLAGVDANEMDGSCHDACASVSGQAARQYVDRLIYRQRLSCVPVRRSYARVVARCRLPDGRDLFCLTIAAGAAVQWDRYWRQYGMGECR